MLQKQKGKALTNSSVRILLSPNGKLKLIDPGFSASERALIPGHEVQTNEHHYSVTDKRKLGGLRDKTAWKRDP